MPDKAGPPGQLRWLWLTVLVIVVDQLTKHLMLTHFQEYERLRVLPVFNLTLVYNPGAAFSFLANAGGWQRWFFTLVAVLAVVLIVAWMARLRAGEGLQGAALALILAGALGNLYDRIQLGHVVDFLDFHWGYAHFPAFNIADSSITVGAALILLEMVLGARRHHD